MPPKGRKVKINMKDFMAKIALSEERPQTQPRSDDEEWEEEVKSQDTKSQDTKSQPESKKADSKREDPPRKEEAQVKREEEGSKKGSTRHPQAGRKEVSLRALMKQVTNDILEQRKRNSFPVQAMEEIGRAAPNVRLFEQFEQLHNHYFRAFDAFKGTPHTEVDQALARFSQRLLASLSELRQARQAEAASLRDEVKDEYHSNVLRHYSTELKLKEEEIRRKRGFREQGRVRFGPQVKQLQDFIAANARLVSEAILRQRFQTVIDRAVAANDQLIVRKQNEYRENIRSLFAEWRKIKLEQMMLAKVERAERIQREERARATLASKFPSLTALAFTPFTIYEELV